MVVINIIKKIRIINIGIVICIVVLIITSMRIVTKNYTTIQNQYEKITVIEKENEELLGEIEEKDREIERLKRELEECKGRLREYELMEMDIGVVNVENLGIMKSYMDYRCIGKGSRQGNRIFL